MRKRTVQESILQAGLLALLMLLGWGAAAPGHGAAAAAPTPPPSVVSTASLTDQTINTTPLPEAVQEIDLRLSGAAYPGCMDVFEEPALDFKTDNLELTGIAMIATCGWQPDEVVKITLMDPSGKITTSEARAVPSKYKKNVYEVDVYYQPGVDALPGKYRFTLEGSGGTVKAKVGFNRPQSPRLYVMADDPFQPHLQAMGGQQRLRLHGFLPNEPVRLLAYRFDGTKIQFYGWQDYTTDGGGQLIIETKLSEISEDTEMNYYAYARETHFVSLERFTREGYSKTRQFDMDLYCPGALAPRLSGVTEIQAAGAARLKVHQQPGYGSRLLVQVPGDTVMRVYGYPKCIDRAYWWKVSIKDPVRFGWVAESFLGKYQVQPVE